MLKTAIRAAREAGRVLLEGSRGEIRVERVAQRDVKLAMDKKAEEVILRVIREKFPGHAILSEESGASGRNRIISGSLIRSTAPSTTPAASRSGERAWRCFIGAGKSSA